MPVQLVPFPEGSGASQIRDRTWYPWPHETEHVVHSIHEPQLPSTVNIYIEFVINIYIVKLKTFFSEDV
jgi:hypothetical protein